jgi:RNase H-fold protein (predicted Holliday junction resolvase)
MFTTKMAQENIKKRGEKNISKMDDQEAARIILQSWLDKDI